MNTTPTLAPEHVVLWNMTTYEWAYIGLILIETIFLIKYAIETIKLRKIADAQLEVIKNQNESMQVQNEMLAKQLKASLEEAAISRQQEIRRISPLFDVRTVATTAGKRFIQIEDVKARIKWSEIRCNTKWTNSSVGIPSPSSKTIEVPGNLSTIYIGIRYHRLVDNEEIAVVFAFNTVTGKAEEEKGMDFYQLPVPN